ncbi:MAG TPA: IS21 family transposase [Ktedonobacterales bacterium]|nr:IS21 family transposase [Ktedonobacterales bacterium]
MAQARLSVRKIREVLRLKNEARLSDRQIAAVLGSARSTVQECLRRARTAGLSWPLPDLDEDELHERLYPRTPSAPRYPTPDFEAIQRELATKGVTRLLLWQEYKAQHPEGCQYSAFCRDYDAWLGRQDAVMRFEHVPGDKAFVDYAGKTMAVVDRHSGEIQVAQVFVAALGASHYTYVEATLTQTVADWLAAHVRSLEYFGGVPRAIVPDNLKSGVRCPCRYEPDLNPSYQDFAEHYGVAILPARVRKPRDKAIVEVGVQGVERWIMAPLRHRTFFSLGELNVALREQLEGYNDRPLSRETGTRRSRFLELERPALRPLPLQRYEYATWKRAKVFLDYHIEHERRYYSVPYRLIGKSVDLRISAHTIEVYYRGQSVARHVKAAGSRRFITEPGHRPERHSAVIELSHERLLERAEAIGPSTAALLREQTARRVHPEEALRASLGILRLAHDFSAGALEHACQRALELKAYSYRAVRTLIIAPAAPSPTSTPTPAHDNVRGAGYFS